MGNDVKVYCYYMEIKDIENLAELAKIELSENEKREMLSDIKSILEYVKVVEKVPACAGEDDVALPYNLKNVWREDKIEQREFSRKLITEQFPDAKDGFLKVKKIL